MMGSVYYNVTEYLDMTKVGGSTTISVKNSEGAGELFLFDSFFAANMEDDVLPPWRIYQASEKNTIKLSGASRGEIDRLQHKVLFGYQSNEEGYMVYGQYNVVLSLNNEEYSYFGLDDDGGLLYRKTNTTNLEVIKINRDDTWEER